MLGRLLHLGSGGSALPPGQAGNGGASCPILSLESVQEDIYTRNLLFPDAQVLRQNRNDQVFPLSAAPATPYASTTNAFDYTDDFDLDVRDVRVLVMQDALGPANASLLFDSHPPDTPVDRSPARRDSKRAPLSPRLASQGQPLRPLALPPESPQHRQGAFDRRASVHRRTQSCVETDVQRAAREYREELATFSNCIFGNSELMAYKGTSTKVHVVPSESRSADHPSSVFGDGRSSIGRSSKLSQSFSQAMSPMGPPPPPSSVVSRHMDKKILITRLFPVNIPAEDAEKNEEPQDRLFDDMASFPFPTTDDPIARKRSQPKQRRTPMYAVVLVVQLPRSSSCTSSTAPLRSLFRECSSYSDQDLFSSSYNSTRAGSSIPGSGHYGDTTDSCYSIEVEDRIDALTQHWDIIMRTLTRLQSLVATTLHTMLKQTDMASPAPSSPVATSLASRVTPTTDRCGHDVHRAKPSKGTTKLVSLLPNCLADNHVLASEVGLARSRVIAGLSAARVVTGQGRWGIWRDEAIWTSKWAASVDRRPFFCNLLTGFLAIHTHWLQALWGSSPRQRGAIARSNKNDEDLSLPARTIIVSEDKMAARRMIFLLSAFLPTNQQLLMMTHRPSTSTSMGCYSHSPPTYVVPILREESLRRKINRRSGLGRASHTRAASHGRSSAHPGQPALLSLERSQHQRRASDAASTRTTNNLPMPGHDLLSRKSSAAATAAMTPETTTHHFSGAAQHQRGGYRRRPGSSGSLAADDLKRSLKRGESIGRQSVTATLRPPGQGLRWGSLVSGLWSPRRRQSLGEEAPSPEAEPRSPVKAGFSRPKRLFEMVRKVSLADEAGGPEPGHAGRGSAVRNFAIPRHDAVPGQGPSMQVDIAPDPTGAFESHMKTTINPEDGVIDVDVPFPDYIASFESAISSPSSSGCLSTPGFLGGLDSFKQPARFSVDGDPPLNAAGWLNRFHPDFVLQALPPQDDLLATIKSSLRAELTPFSDPTWPNEIPERWIDVSSVLIADTTSNTITRYVYRRLVSSKAVAEHSGPGNPAGPVLNGLTPLTLSVQLNEPWLQEEWVEDVISTSDSALREAVERVIHFSADASKDTSTSSSQTRSDFRGSAEGARPAPDAITEAARMAHPPPDMPRVQCKTIILSTLEDMIRDAVDSRDLNGEQRLPAQRPTRKGQNVLQDAVRNWVADMGPMD